MSEPLALHGRDLFGHVVTPAPTGAVAGRFTFPPFSILDTKSGEWQERRDGWKALGIKSEVGRSEGLLGGGGSAEEGNILATINEGTSIFDPVLCELAYRWWSPPGGVVLDPFAGGSVRGIVASKLGRQYHGVDLREEQVNANYEQATTICEGDDYPPRWYVGDSMDLGTAFALPRADFVFSCPPYADLEQYSTDPRDLSTMDYSDFRAFYRVIIGRAVALLKEDRFACFVVGEIRDPKTGHYRNFVGDTVKAFQDAGAAFYNEASLLNSIGTAAARVTRQFNGGRKLVKVHQTLLTFVKGDWKRATLALGAVEGSQ
jgi:hypothetical protein